MNKHVGSCPECGTPIWTNDEIFPNVFKCLKCKKIFTREEVVPF